MRIPKGWLYEIATYDAADLLGGIIVVVSTALCWNRADTETFTATFRRADGRTLHVRKVTRAEPPQQAIYAALTLDPEPGGIRKTIV